MYMVGRYVKLTVSLMRAIISAVLQRSVLTSGLEAGELTQQMKTADQRLRNKEARAVP